MSIDLNSSSALPDRINWHIDHALVAMEEAPRNYLGMSAIGGECERAVQLDAYASAWRKEWARSGRAPIGEDVPARTRRIFERGILLEDSAAKWLLQAGFVLLQSDPLAGGQFSVSLCGGRLRGHADGIVYGWRGEGPCPVETPCLWECKVLGHKWIQALKKEKARKSHPKYYGQVNLYMKGLGLERCLLTAVDADTMELHHELVQYDSAEAERLEARFGRIALSCSAGELLPKASASRSEFMCRMCRRADVCWSL